MIYTVEMDRYAEYNWEDLDFSSISDITITVANGDTKKDGFLSSVYSKRGGRQNNSYHHGN